jgi:hypothetical protein
LQQGAIVAHAQQHLGVALGQIRTLKIAGNQLKFTHSKHYQKMSFSGSFYGLNRQYEP